MLQRIHQRHQTDARFIFTPFILNLIYNHGLRQSLSAIEPTRIFYLPPSFHRIYNSRLQRGNQQHQTDAYLLLNPPSPTTFTLAFKGTIYDIKPTRIFYLSPSAHPIHNFWLQGTHQRHQTDTRFISTTVTLALLQVY